MGIVAKIVQNKKRTMRRKFIITLFLHTILSSPLYSYLYICFKNLTAKAHLHLFYKLSLDLVPISAV
jgi:hypothetical protein